MISSWIWEWSTSVEALVLKSFSWWDQSVEFQLQSSGGLSWCYNRMEISRLKSLDPHHVYAQNCSRWFLFPVFCSCSCSWGSRKVDLRSHWSLHCKRWPGSPSCSVGGRTFLNQTCRSLPPLHVLCYLRHDQQTSWVPSRPELATNLPSLSETFRCS